MVILDGPTYIPKIYIVVLTTIQSPSNQRYRKVTNYRFFNFIYPLTKDFKLFSIQNSVKTKINKQAHKSADTNSTLVVRKFRWEPTSWPVSKPAYLHIMVRAVEKIGDRNKPYVTRDRLVSWCAQDFLIYYGVHVNGDKSSHS